jgi:hypothetical protein
MRRRQVGAVPRGMTFAGGPGAARFQDFGKEK